jgi:polar amino acid transport system substrate-binding protein
MRKTIHILIFTAWVTAMAMPSLAQDATLRVICDEWPPYQILERNGTLSGFSTNVVKEIFRRMGVTITGLHPYPWKRALLMLKNGEVDALFSANYTQERTTFAYYPEETIMDSPWVIWTRTKDKITFTSLTDLKGKHIGVVRGYSYTPEFWRTLKSLNNYEGVSDDETNFKKLNAGRIDMLVAELGNGYDIINRLGLSGITPHKKHPIKTDGLYIIFNKTKVSEEFVKRFSKNLKQLKRENLYRLFHDHFFNSGSIPP